MITSLPPGKKFRYPAPTESSVLKELHLVRGLVAGKNQAQSQAYRMYSASLRGVIYNMVKCTETAEDLLQDTFVKIFCNISSYSGDRSRLFTWMINIARHTGIDYLRLRNTKDRMKNDNLSDFLHQVEDQTSHSLFTDGIGVKSLLVNLPVRQKRVLELIYFQGYTHDEAAKALNMPLGSVKTSLRLAILSLREQFIFPVAQSAGLAS